MRIVSLLASGTELVCALGAGDELVGRSHECDDPAWVTALPPLSWPTFDTTGSSADIDALVRERLRAGAPLYHIDRARLDELAPDVVITQSHCDVCAVGPTALAFDEAHQRPGLEGQRTVAMSGGSLDGILRDFERVGAAIGRDAEAAALVASLRDQRTAWRRATAALKRPRVVCLEWIDPPFAMGNWGPELVELAGGTSVLGTPNAHSTAAPWQAVLDADPDVLVVAVCGFGLARALAEMPTLAAYPGWFSLRAVRSGRVYVSEGNRLFNRSGPAVFETIQVLAEMFHPDVLRPLRHPSQVDEPTAPTRAGASQVEVWRPWRG